ncbi:hypothetical protein DRO69_10675, partial [Candidatus Bathyarchaeota archaeon]
IFQFKCYSNGPLAEKPMAKRAGVGWYGKNGIILTRDYGSWIVLGEIITNLELEEDAPLKKSCKSCQACIKACPTNALYWKTGEIGIVKELCIYCSACVLSCVVDDCIQVSRRRANGEIEKFSNSGQVLRLLQDINTRKREKMVRLLFPDEKAYLKRYCDLEL